MYMYMYMYVRIKDWWTFPTATWVCTTMFLHVNVISAIYAVCLWNSDFCVGQQCYSHNWKWSWRFIISHPPVAANQGNIKRRGHATLDALPIDVEILDVTKNSKSGCSCKCYIIFTGIGDNLQVNETIIKVWLAPQDQFQSFCLFKHAYLHVLQYERYGKSTYGYAGKIFHLRSSCHADRYVPPCTDAPICIPHTMYAGRVHCILHPVPALPQSLQSWRVKLLLSQYKGCTCISHCAFQCSHRLFIQKWNMKFIMIMFRYV